MALGNLRINWLMERDNVSPHNSLYEPNLCGTVAVDALTPCVAISPAAMVLNTNGFAGWTGRRLLWVKISTICPIWVIDY